MGSPPLHGGSLEITLTVHSNKNIPKSNIALDTKAMNFLQNPEVLTEALSADIQYYLCLGSWAAHIFWI